MRILSVNVGMPAPLPEVEGAVVSGIVKRPVDGRVPVRPLNLDGDGQADLRVHGGPDKAVYAYPSEHYPLWAAELGRDDLAWGRFGENLTTEGLLEEDVLVGDRFRAGTALLEVSQPRIPCYKLGIRMADPGFLRTFLASGRSGFYLRVVEEGELAAGDPIAREGRGEGGVTIHDLVELFGRSGTPDELRHAAAPPALAPVWARMLLEHADTIERREARGL